MQVIDLADDVPAGSTVSHSVVTNSTLPSLQIHPSTSTASPSSSLTQQVSSTPAVAPVATAQVSSPPPPLLALSTSSHTPQDVHSSAPTLPPSPLLLPSRPMPRDNEMPPSQAVAGENSTTTISDISTSPPAMNTALGEPGQQIQPRQVNYFSQAARQSFTDRMCVSDKPIVSTEQVMTVVGNGI